MKKYIALLLAIVLCLTVLVGCASQQTPDVPSLRIQLRNRPPRRQKPPLSTKLLKRRMSSCGTTGRLNLTRSPFRQRSMPYNASQTAYKVTAKYVPFADFKKQLSIGAVAEALPDMVILDSPDHASYASMGIFADITGKDRCFRLF